MTKHIINLRFLAFIISMLMNSVISAQHFGNQFYLKYLATPYEWQSDYNYKQIRFSNSPAKYYLMREHISHEISDHVTVTNGPVLNQITGSPRLISQHEIGSYHRKVYSLSYQQQNEGLQQVGFQYKPRLNIPIKNGTPTLSVRGGMREWTNRRSIGLDSWTDQSTSYQAGLDFSIVTPKNKFNINSIFLTSRSMMENRFVDRALYRDMRQDNTLSATRINLSRNLSRNVVWNSTLRHTYYEESTFDPESRMMGPAPVENSLHHSQIELNSGITLNRKKLRVETNVFGQHTSDSEQYFLFRPPASAGHVNRAIAGLAQRATWFRKESNSRVQFNVEYAHSLFFDFVENAPSTFHYQPFARFKVERSTLSSVLGYAKGSQLVYYNQLYRTSRIAPPNTRSYAINRNENTESLWLHTKFRIGDMNVNVMLNQLTSDNRLYPGTDWLSLKTTNREAQIQFTTYRRDAQNSLTYAYNENINNLNLLLVPEHRITFSYYSNRSIYSKYVRFNSMTFGIKPKLNLGLQSDYHLPYTDGIYTVDAGLYSDFYLQFFLTRNERRPSTFALDAGVTNLFHQTPDIQDVSFLQETTLRNIQGRRFQLRLTVRFKDS